jgi:hypothetical protein
MYALAVTRWYGPETAMILDKAFNKKKHMQYLLFSKERRWQNNFTNQNANKILAQHLIMKRKT